MGTKIDLISASKKKGYKIAMYVVLGLGIVLLALGLILMATVTQTVMPNKLAITMSGLEGNKGNYTATISIDEYVTVDTGTGAKPLTEAIVFTLDEGAQTFLQPVASRHRAGVFALRIKADAPDGATGTVLIACGSMPTIKLSLTYKKP